MSTVPLFDPVCTLRPLRDYQSRAIESVRQAIRGGHKRIMLQAPTGAGKTLLAAHMITSALDRGRKPLFTCPAITLVEQTLAAFEAEGISDIGVMQAQHHRTRRDAAVQIASVDTLIRREQPDSDFMLQDEAHEPREAMQIMLSSSAWKDRIVIGFSATPWAKGLGKHWSKLIVAATIHELINAGYLTPARIFGPDHDLDRASLGVKPTGEFDESDASGAMSQPTIVGDIIEEWKKGPREKTFGFFVNRAHASSQMEAFNDCGIPFGYIDGMTPMEQRRRIFEQLKYGELAGIASVGCLIRGVDEDVRCVIDAQPTRSEMKHVQKWGRGIRGAPGKTELYGVDAAGNNISLGRFDEIHHDHLDMGEKGKSEPYQDDDKPVKPRKCKECNAILSPRSKACFLCGAKVAQQPHGVVTIDGRLVELGSRSLKARKEQQSFYSGLLRIERDRGFKSGFAAVQFKERFGEWPRGLESKARKNEEASQWWEEKRKAYLAKKKEMVGA